MPDRTSTATRIAVPAADRAALVLPADADARTQRLFRAFVADGRITVLPAKHGKRMVVLDLVAQRFEPGVRYSEVEVNAILREVYDDYVTLRRLLVDDDFLDRDHGVYWRSGGTVAV